MTTYDAVMIGAIVAGMVFGAVRGVTWQIAGIGSLVLAYFFSYEVSAYLAPYIPGEPVVRRAGSMLAAYVAVSFGVFAAAWAVRATLKKLKFEAYDRHLGMVLGGIEGALLGVVGTLFVVSFAPSTREPIFGSVSGRAVAHVMDSAGPVLPEEVRDVVAPFWDHVTDPSHAPRIAREAAPREEEEALDGSSLRDLARGAGSRLRRAASDAVRAEVDRLGEAVDEGGPRRR